MFKQAHSPKYKEICKYNRSFKSLRGLGWVNLKECALSIHKKLGKSAAVLFHLGMALCHVHAIKISFSPDSSLSSATDCHLGQEVKEFYEILARFTIISLHTLQTGEETLNFKIILLLSVKYSVCT